MQIYANNNDFIANIRVSDISEAKLWFSHVKRSEFACEMRRNEANIYSTKLFYRSECEYLFAKTILAKQIYEEKKSHPDGCKGCIRSALRKSREGQPLFGGDRRAFGKLKDFDVDVTFKFLR